MPERPLVQFRADPEVVDAIADAAEAEGVDRATWLRRAVDAALLRHPAAAPTKRERVKPEECWHDPRMRRASGRCGACGAEIASRITTTRL